MSNHKGTKPWNYGTSKGWVDKRGYRWLYVVENGRRRARREHRVVMEKYLGRTLEPWELVHHKDGNPLNNCLDNLEIKDWGEHTTEHHLGGRKGEDARRSIQAFALMREQLSHERTVNADLLEALECLTESMDALMDAIASSNMQAGDDDFRALSVARSAIARAKRGQ